MARLRECKPTLRRMLLGGLAAGVLCAAANGVYFVAYVGATRLGVREPTLASVAVSSILPLLVAALGYSVLCRLTDKASTVAAVSSAAITIASFEGLLRETMPDGTLKPAGFDGLVMPMHVVVGVAAVLLVRRFARIQSVEFSTAPKAIDRAGSA